MNWFESANDFLKKWKSQGTAPSEFADQFTPRAKISLALAHDEAESLHHNHIGTEHILLGLIKLGQGAAGNVLTQSGLNFENVRREVENLMGIGPDPYIAGNIPYTPRTRKVIKVAMNEARKLNHAYVGPEHLLLALLSEREDATAKVFKKLNVDKDQTRKGILKEIDPPFPSGDDGQKKSI